MRGSSSVVEVVLRDGDTNLEEDDCVQVLPDGTLVHVVNHKKDDCVQVLPDRTVVHVICSDTTSTALEVEAKVELGETTGTGVEVGGTGELVVKTIQACFEEARAQRCPEGGLRIVEDSQEAFASMGLTFQKVEPPNGTWADMTENADPEQEYEQAMETARVVLGDTGGARSLAFSGPTSMSADRTVAKHLVFPCGGEACECPTPQLFTLNRLMPTKVGSKKKDLCIKCFNKQVNGKMGTKAFTVGVASMRACEKAAVTVTDAMTHAPIESIIHNAYTSLVKNSAGEQKKFLKKMGAKKYHKLVMGLMKNKPSPKNDAGLMAAQTLQDVVSMAQAAHVYFCANCLHAGFFFLAALLPHASLTPPFFLFFV